LSRERRQQLRRITAGMIAQSRGARTKRASAAARQSTQQQAAETLDADSE
jgi:hypothetical protein